MGQKVYNMLLVQLVFDRPVALRALSREHGVQAAFQMSGRPLMQLKLDFRPGEADRPSKLQPWRSLELWGLLSHSIAQRNSSAEIRL